MTPGGYANYTEGPDFAPNAAPSVVAGPPLEEHLAQNTLWPEVRGGEVPDVASGHMKQPAQEQSDHCQGETAAWTPGTKVLIPCNPPFHDL